MNIYTFEFYRPAHDPRERGFYSIKIVAGDADSAYDRLEEIYQATSIELVDEDLVTQPIILFHTLRSTHEDPK